jgi:dCMP deaminase
MRPDWDSYFMKIAYAVSERSTCDRAFVGCVLVVDKRILTTGFNGSPAGQDHCDEIGHLMVDGHCVRTIHAETNAIIQAGISRIVYSVAYRIDENAMNFLKAADIEVSQKEFVPAT